MLKHLNEVNDVKIYSVLDPEFAPYGRVVVGYDFSDLVAYMKEHTAIPEAGNFYTPSVPEMEAMPIYAELTAKFYGGMPMQIGYCNGKNSTYNGFEYHKGSELNVAITPFMLVLGHTWQLKENKFYVGEEKVFFVPEGVAIEMYQTTLHLSPLKVTDGGYKDIVILPRGTNTPLAQKPVANAGGNADADSETKLLLHTNKWVIAHNDREPLIKQGAFPGLIGENKELKY